MTLPKSDRGPGYARWVVQRTCLRSYETDTTKKYPKQVRRRVPFVWICDDLLSMFYKLVPLHIRRANTLVKCQRLKKREAPRGNPMFRDAMLEVQGHSFLPRAAVAGFLRDD